MNGSRCSTWEPSSSSGFMGTAFGSQGSKNHHQGMLSWRSYVPCARSCKVGGYPLLLPALKEAVFHGVSSADSRDGEGTPQGKDTLDYLKKLLTLQNASTWPRCYYSFSHFPIWIAENNCWGFWVKRILILMFHYENEESQAWKYTCKMIPGRGELCSQAWIQTSSRSMGLPDCGFR